MIIVVAALAAGLGAVALLGGFEAAPPVVAATSSAPPARDSVAIDICAEMHRVDITTANMQAMGDQASASQVPAIRAAGVKLREQALTAAQKGTPSDVARMEALAADLIAECRNAGYA